jgi:hypothetical protein
VFWSKIWFFLVAVGAAVAMTVALVMPRPAERATRISEKQQIERACSVGNILLRDNARSRVQLASEFARAAAPADDPKLELGAILFQASRGDIISGESHATAKKALLVLMRSFEGGKPPSFVLLLDRNGRVAARTGTEDDTVYGDSMRGYFLIDDALDGYLRDDLWVVGGNLYRVAASPVITNTAPFEYAGAVVLGHALDGEFAAEIGKSLSVNISFYVGRDAVASSDAVQIHEEVVTKFKALGLEETGVCNEEPFSVSAGGETYDVVVSRLPGEAGQLGAFYAVSYPREKAIGFMGTFNSLRKDDLSFASFPWVRVILLFLLMIAVGLGLMVFEGDWPVRRLSKDAVVLAKGEAERLAEERHRGKHGSIARSVNIAIDKLHREARSARKELDELLGPLPPDEARAMGAPSPIPMVGPSGPPPADFKPPPPSEFRFSDIGGAPGPAGPGPARPVLAASPTDFQLDLPPPPPNVASAPTPIPAAPVDQPIPPPPISLPQKTPPPMPRPVVAAIDDDILGGRSRVPEDEQTVVSDAPGRIAADDAENLYFREVFEDFLALKRKCGENTQNLTFEKFSGKLRSNRDALIAKHGCRTVKFQVYVKDGKAALKASPVR